MKQNKDINSILDECLERLFRGETVEQCLRSYPGQAVELDALLRTAVAVKRAAAVNPGVAFRARAREEFHTALREMEAKRGIHFFGLQSWAATAVAVLLAVVVLGSSTVAAAGDSMPGQPLYPVKLAAEQVRIALTPSEMGKAELYTRLADKRVNELVYVAGKGDSEQVALVSQKLDEHLNKVAILAGTGGVVEKASVEKPLMAPAPAPVAEAPRVMAVPPAPAQPQKESPKEGPVVMAPAQAPPPAVATAPAPQASQEAKVAPRAVDKRAELNMAVENKSAVNLKRLKAALAVAPESAKPALEQAIKQAETSYKKAIEATQPKAISEDTSKKSEKEPVAPATDKKTSEKPPSEPGVGKEAQKNLPVTGEKNTKDAPAESSQKGEADKNPASSKENGAGNAPPKTQKSERANQGNERQKSSSP